MAQCRVGVPARVIRDATEEDKETWSYYKQKYAELCGRYKAGLKSTLCSGPRLNAVALVLKKHFKL